MRRALSALAVVVIAIAALTVVGTYVPALGAVARRMPGDVLWLVLLPLAAATLALSVRRDRIGAALAAVALLTATGATVITVRMTAAVERAGADVDLLRTLGFGEHPQSRPDAEVTYAEYAGEQLKLSIFRPRDAGRAPVLVHVHGGGWIAGGRNDRSGDLRWFADQGWLAVGVDYPLSSGSRHLWDVTADHVRCALSWLGRNASGYGGDPARLALLGDSAGGGLAIAVAYRPASAMSCGPAVAAAAVVAMYPVVDAAGLHDAGELGRELAVAYTGGSPQSVPDRYRSVSAAAHLTADAPPTLIVVGEADRLVPPQGAYAFTEQARALGVDVTLVRVPYAGHDLDDVASGIGHQAYRQLTLAWLRDRGLAPASVA